MKRRTYFKTLFVSIVLSYLFSGSLVFAMNLLQPYDVLIRPPYTDRKRFQVYAMVEHGVANLNFDEDGRRVDALQIWNPDQNALAMLNGFPANSPIGQLRQRIDADDDGTRGHFDVSSNFNLDISAALAARYFLGAWSFSAYLPFYRMQLKDVQFVDKTEKNNDADCRVKELLTNDLFANVKKLGDLDLSGWKRGGPGDLTLLIEWFDNFPQAKPFLKNVGINWYSGISLPTGLRRDEDKIFAIPFGNDGAFALPFGLGLNLTFGEYVKAGLDVQLIHTFDNTRNRRIKTDLNQTDLLLLQKVDAHKDFGLTQKFSLYVELYKIIKGLSCKVGYQFFKHGEDVLFLGANAFSSEIANTTQNLEDWTAHQIVTNFSYDFAEHLDEDAAVLPYLGLFARVPFNGKRSALQRTVGITFSVDF